MRKLSTIQKRENLNVVYAVDERGNGNANHLYQINALTKVDGLSGECEAITDWSIQFQNGARKDENAIQGVLDGDLLEIVRDRLIGFQSGKFASEYNQKALEHIELALMYMNRRVEDRIERSVLGTYKK